jgi:hypothetical protein
MIGISTTPAAGLHAPTPVTLDPSRLGVVVAVAFTNPGSRYPLMLMLAVPPFPVPGNPHVPTARVRSDLHAGRWRCDANDDLGTCRYGDACEGCREHCGNENFPDHGYLLNVCFV